MPHQEHIINSQPIFSGRVVNLRVDTIQTATGQTYQREIIEHPGAVALVPLDEDGNVILVQQYRAGAGQDLLEIPAGGLEPGETREACARRELQEEVGLRPEELIELGDFYVAASYTTERITIYLARGLRPSALEGDQDEEIAAQRVPFRRALDMALVNEIRDSKTIIGLVWAARHLDRTGSLPGTP